MKYPKALMSITELVAMGFSRYELNCIIHDPDAPVIWSVGKGKAKIVTEELDEYLTMRSQRSQKKEPRNKTPWSQRKSHLLAQVTQKN